MNIGFILKSLRLEKGLTQTELGEILHIGQATIACYENSQREPHIANLMAYADYFECSIDYIVGRTDDMGNIVISADRAGSTGNALNAEEKKMLKNYRKLSNSQKLKLEGYSEGLLAK